jgi:thiol-disulfide isomerase/thioredoxin
MKRKLLPLFIFILAASTTLTTQFFFNSYRSVAGDVNFKKGQKEKFEKIFQGLKLETFQGPSFDLKNFKDKIVLINFWASWCLPCTKEFSGLNELNKKFKEKLTIIGINTDTDEPEKNLLMIKKKYSLSFPSVLDSKNAYLDLFGFEHIPVTIIFHKGKVVYLSEKYTNFADEKLLKMLSSL